MKYYHFQEEVVDHSQLCVREIVNDMCNGRELKSIALIEDIHWHISSPVAIYTDSWF